MTKTLLLADDSVVIQKLVGLSFANEAIELITTDNGDDAITRAREARPDLVLADVVMPGCSGYEVCEAIKQDPDLAHIPVLLLTGTFEAFDEERAAAVGSDGHITKPFEAQVLVERVNELLSQNASAASHLTPVQSEAAPAAADDAFEFFDDDPEPLAAAPLVDVSSPAANAKTVATELGSADDAAFAFGGGDAGIASAPSLDADARSEPGGDRTIAMMPADAAAVSGSKLGNTMDFEELGATMLAESVDEPLGDDLGATMLVDDPFGDNEPDLSFSDEPLAPVDDLEVDPIEAPPAVARADDTLLADDLFSSGGSLDVSSDVEAITPATPLEDLGLAHEQPPPLIDSDSDRGVMRLDLGADDEAAPEIDAISAPVFDPPPSEAPTELPMEVISHEPTFLESEPMSAADSFTSQAQLGNHLDSPTDAIATAAPEPFATPVPEAISAPALEAVQQATPSLPDLSPMLRERLHESLEKIAWEAFADLSDTIVKQVLQRVEAVAWEVIPQMAEALIQEEIRRMKGGGED